MGFCSARFLDALKRRQSMRQIQPIRFSHHDALGFLCNHKNASQELVMTDRMNALSDKNKPKNNESALKELRALGASLTVYSKIRYCGNREA